MTGERPKEDAAPPRRLGWRTLAIAAAVGLVGAAAVLAQRELSQPVARTVIVADDSAAGARPTDRLSADLDHCRSLDAGTDDAGCQAVWDANRRRFFGIPGSVDAAPRASTAE